MLDRTVTIAPSLDLVRPQLPHPHDDLATCIANANRCYLAARHAAGESVRYAAETGQWLLRIKRLVGYGNWCRWLHKNRSRLEFSPSSASGYLRLANLPSKDFQRVANLSLREALRVAAVLNAGNRRPRSVTPSPTLGEPGATVLLALLDLYGPDVVLAHIRSLKAVSRISSQQYAKAARALHARLAVRRKRTARR
jgi:hypothetical protein